MNVLTRVVRGLSTVFLFAAFGVAAPFAAVGLFLESCADDLEGGWRRGRKQNWLWQWARCQRPPPHPSSIPAKGS